MTRKPDSAIEASLSTRRDGERDDPRTWFITGASSGLGRALAQYVLLRGDRVVLASRTVVGPGILTLE